jgi:hypothetical protein
MSNEPEIKAPPYLPLKTFFNALDSLKEGVPKKIDRGIWIRQSGANQAQIMIALRFFDLLDNSDSPTLPLLEQLAKADEAQRKKLFKPLVEKHYQSIISHDLTKMTPKMLDEAMEGFGVNGDTRRKAITFFLQAAKYLELPLSPFLTEKTHVSPSKGKTKRSKAVASNGAAPSLQAPAPSGSTTSVTLKGGGTVTMVVTADVWKMPSDDRAFVLDLVDKIQGYEKSPAAAKPKGKAAGQS